MTEQEEFNDLEMKTKVYKGIVREGCYGENCDALFSTKL